MLYYVLHKVSNLYVQQVSYLDSFVGWGKVELPLIADRLVLYAYDLLSGNSVYRGGFYGVSVVLGLLAACLLWRREKDKQKALFLILLLIALLFSPFLLPLALGGGIPIRSQLVLPLIVAVSFYVFYLLCAASETVKEYFLLASASLFIRLRELRQLFYGEYMKEQFDAAMAQQIAHELEVVKRILRKPRRCFLWENINLCFIRMRYGSRK